MTHFFGVNLISRGRKKKKKKKKSLSVRCYLCSVYVHLVKSWRHFCPHNRLCARAKCQALPEIKYSKKPYEKQLKVVRRGFFDASLRNVNI